MQDSNFPIFIPILSIPGLMGNINTHSEFYREFNYYKEKESILYEREELIMYCGNALVPIVIRPEIDKCKQQKEKSKQIPFVTLIAMIDTGAGISAINKSKIKSLKVKPFPGLEITGFSMKPQKCANVNLSIHIQNVFPDTGFLDICAIAPKIWDKKKPFDFIIGWDILRYCKFTYDGPTAKFKLEFINPNLKA